MMPDDVPMTIEKMHEHMANLPAEIRQLVEPAMIRRLAELTNSYQRTVEMATRFIGMSYSDAADRVDRW